MRFDSAKRWKRAAKLLPERNQYRSQPGSGRSQRCSDTAGIFADNCNIRIKLLKHLSVPPPVSVSP
jgi:hypothetical protein